ncbi:pentapeptide repeat-containing protein [Lacticaseibacillus hegangensis]|uniref:Pentapeptide repeat-containing protein n=1 Tax=Lacticaseibacillus hegangensis TaxID=2486010 RepID=A0ABW4CUP6_9LACO|nr:pentapeptide repeat-containing protein [Lacticaseibacillus hegangensis]
METIIDEAVAAMIKGQTLSLDEVQEDQTYSGCTLTVSNEDIQLSGVTFVNCAFAQTDFRGGEWLDCTVKGSRFLTADFTGSVMYRCRFEGCQLMGADFTRSTWRDVTVQDCQATYLILAEAKLKNVQFVDTKLTESSFQAASIVKPGLKISGGDVTGADFSDAKLAQVNLAKTHFDSLLFTPALLQGLKINQFQAAVIAGSLGADIVAE